MRICILLLPSLGALEGMYIRDWIKLADGKLRDVDEHIYATAGYSYRAKYSIGEGRKNVFLCPILGTREKKEGGLSRERTLSS